MSRLFITDAAMLFSKAVKLTKESGLDKHRTIKEKELNIAVFEKRVVSAGNFYQKNAEEYIAATGTFIYKNRKGTEALKLLLEDFDGNVIKCKKECVGMYNLIIRKKSAVFIFGDYYGLYDLYYTRLTSGNYFIGNNLGILSGSIGLSEINKEMLMADCIGISHFDSQDTLFKNVFRLRGGEYLKIVADRLMLEEIPWSEYSIDYCYESEEKTIRDIRAVFSKYLPQIKNNFKNIAVNMTGGLDSRLVFALFNNEGCDIHFLYGKGKSKETITCDEDRIIVENIAQKFQCPLYFMNWNAQDESDGEYLDRRRYFFKKYGFTNIYDANTNIELEYAGKIVPYPEFMDFGYFGECFRLRDWAEQIREDYFTVDSFINDYLLGKLKNAPIGWDLTTLKSNLKRTISQWIIKLGIPEYNGKISLNYIESLRWIAARFSDTRMYYWINEFTYSFPILSIPEVHRIVLSLPADLIRNSQFQIKFIRIINPEYLDRLDVFSHRRLFKISKSGKKVRRFSLKNTADSVLKKVPFISVPLKSLYRKIYYQSYRNWKDNCQKDLQRINIPLLDMGEVHNNIVYHNYNYFLACYSELLQICKNKQLL